MNLFDYTYDLVKQIPDGKISTYGAVAEALGDKRAARAVGRMMNQNPDPDFMPCFKIVYSDGKLGGFGLGIDDKIKRLDKDGIKVIDGNIVDFKNVLFKEFKTNYPLMKFRKNQKILSKKVIRTDHFDKIDTVAGFDCAYSKNEFENCCCACVVIDYKSKKIIEQKTIISKIDFPYIPTYLSYRELPLFTKVFKKLKTNPTIIMIDGNGILHPLEFGIASQIGIELDFPTIGVAKNLLSGTIENNKITINGKHVGYSYYSSNRVKKPIYVSPGHKISLKTSIKIVKNLCKFKIPEPIRQAHILANKEI